MLGSVRTRERATQELLRWAPKDAFSRTVGRLARISVPRPLRRPLYRGFALAAGVDLAEVDRPLDEFRDFDDFFTRPHAPGARPIAEGEGVVVSPVDGTVASWGLAEDGRLIQAKGIDYSLEGLLSDPSEAARFEGGAYATLYLAPRNYHRIHAPVEGSIVGYRHVPGECYPVNRLAVTTIPGLFAANERIITYLDSAVGRVAVVKIAATGVGHISLSYEPGVSSHAPGIEPGSPGRVGAYSTPLPVVRGGELGCFHLGSTVVVLFEAGRVQLSLVEGSPIRLGEPLGRARQARRRR